MVALAAKLKAPIVHAMRGKEHVEWDNPYDVGMTGLIGFSSGYHAMEGCDTLLMLGTDFPYRQFYPTKARIAQIDIRGENLGRRCRLDLGVIGDVREVLSRLTERVSARADDSHLSAAVSHYAKARKDLDDLASEHSKHTPIHPQLLAKVVSDLANEDAIFTCDVGEPVGVGSTISQDERQAPAAGLIPARIDGQCDAAGHRGAVRDAWPTSHFHVG